MCISASTPIGRTRRGAIRLLQGLHPPARATRKPRRVLTITAGAKAPEWKAKTPAAAAPAVVRCIVKNGLAGASLKPPYAKVARAALKVPTMAVATNTGRVRGRLAARPRRSAELRPRPREREGRSFPVTLRAEPGLDPTRPADPPMVRLEPPVGP